MWTAWGLKWLRSLVSVTETLTGVSAATGGNSYDPCAHRFTSKKTGKEGIQANSLPMTKSKQIQLEGWWIASW